MALEKYNEIRQGLADTQVCHTLLSTMNIHPLPKLTL